MATQTGTLSIDEIRWNPGDDVAVIRGVFHSLYDNNVGDASRLWAADMLREGLLKCASITMGRGALLEQIGHVEFATPRSEVTRFEVHVDPGVAAKLRCDSWDSYTLG